MSSEVYNKYRNRLFKWCLAKTNNFSDAEDLLQEINYQLLLACSKDIIIINEERFIWKIAYYTWCKKVKEYIKQKNVVSLSEELENVIKDGNVDILRKVEMEEVKELLSNLIVSLDPISEKCIRLYYYENFSIKEIGTKLNMKDSLVKYYLYKARKQLRRKIENEKS